MKKLVLILFFLVTGLCSRAQVLQSGVFTIDTLVSLNHTGQSCSPCYCWEWHCFYNCFPYVTGMDLYIRIDSIAGPANSIYLYRFPTIMYDTISAGDSILVTSSTNNIYVYYNYNATLYISLLAIGTPSISGEPYYCSFGYFTGIVIDGCNNWITDFYGGNGPMDTVQGCYVDGIPTGEKESETLSFNFFPNPATNEFKVESRVLGTKLKVEAVEVYDVVGKQVKALTLNPSPPGEGLRVDVSALAEGIYFVRIKTENGSVTKKLIIVK